MGVYLRELAPVAEPADVREIRCRLLHPGHPRVVDQGEGDAVLAQQCRQVGAEPAPVAHLDSVARPLRQGRQEILEYPIPSTVNEGGSWRSRGPSLSSRACIVWTKVSASLRVSTRFFSCVTSCGTFAAKRKPSGTISRHFSTVERRGVP